MPQIEAKNSGILEVPAGKNVNDLPQSHFEKLVDKIGYEKVIRALTNLEVWNKDKNKALSTWASGMADKLKKKFRPESTQKNETVYYELRKLDKARRLLDIVKGSSFNELMNKRLKLRKPNDNYVWEIISYEDGFKNPKILDSTDWYTKDNIRKQYTGPQPLKESMSTKQLLEAANRKCEMRWKVLAFNPAEDNKLVKEFKDFDCIDCAVAKKREYLEKNPTHIVEVISESKTQKNEEQVKLVVEQTHPSKVIDTKIFNSRADLLKYKQKYKKDYDAGKVTFNTYAVESSQKNEVKNGTIVKNVQSRQDAYDMIVDEVKYDSNLSKKYKVYYPSNLKNEIHALNKITGKSEVVAIYNPKNNTAEVFLESSQKNEASSLQALNKELANNVENLYVMAKHVRDRFKYRTLQNMSYDEAQAEKIYDQIEDVIEDAVKKLAAINSKVIG